MESEEFKLEVVDRLARIETGQYNMKTEMGNKLDAVIETVQEHEKALTFMKGMNYVLHGLWALSLASISAFFGSKR